MPIVPAQQSTKPNGRFMNRSYKKPAPHSYFTDEFGDGTSIVHPVYGPGVFFTEDCRKGLP